MIFNSFTHSNPIWFYAGRPLLKYMSARCVCDAHYYKKVKKNFGKIILHILKNLSLLFYNTRSIRDDQIRWLRIFQRELESISSRTAASIGLRRRQKLFESVTTSLFHTHSLQSKWTSLPKHCHRNFFLMWGTFGCTTVTVLWGNNNLIESFQIRESNSVTDLD